MSFYKQSLVLEEKRANYQKLNEKFKSMSWSDIRNEFIKNHPTRYFDQIKHLDIPLDDKIQLMQQFFQKQLDLIQAQQSLSEIKVGVGSPISAGTIVLNNSDNNSSESQSQVPLEVTRSGRVTKRPLFYQTVQDTSSPSNDSKTKTNNKIKQTKQNQTPDKKENVASEDVKKRYTNTYAKRTISKYEMQNSVLFDSLLTDNSQTTESDKKLEETNDNADKDDNVFTLTPEQKSNMMKRKYDDINNRNNSTESILEDDHPLVTKRNKRNRFFTSKNRDEVVKSDVIKSDVVNCDSSDSENEQSILVKRNDHPQIIDTANLSSDTSPVLIAQKRNTINRKRPIEMKTCPICSEKFSEHEIQEHASSCGES